MQTLLPPRREPVSSWCLQITGSFFRAAGTPGGALGLDVAVDGTVMAEGAPPTG
jgi:hypothetical protein